MAYTVLLKELCLLGTKRNVKKNKFGLPNLLDKPDKVDAHTGWGG